MPDRYGENPDRDGRDYGRDYAARLDIDACTLCDRDGIRNGFACDHQDHTSAARRGMDMIRAAMGWDS